HVRHVQKIVREVFLDQVALVSEADDEVMQAVRRVDLHDVPQDRPAADLDHGLGLHHGLLAQPRAKSARENHDLQVGILSRYKVSIHQGMQCAAEVSIALLSALFYRLCRRLPTAVRDAIIPYRAAALRGGVSPWGESPQISGRPYKVTLTLPIWSAG